MNNSEFKPFDKVLVRDSNTQNWIINIFEKYKPDNEYPYNCLSSRYKQCIPYKDNESLLGTNNSPKLEYKFKEGDAVIVWDNNTPDKCYVRVFNSKDEFNYYTYNRSDKTITRWDNCIPFKPENENS